MKRKPASCAITTFCLAGSICSVAWSQGPGGPEQSPEGGSPAEAKPAPRPRVRWPRALKLPDQYRSRDLDKDGQIGMYEWPKSDYATFRRLDLNHDGFLTPQELTPTASNKPAAPPVAVTQYPPDAAAAEVRTSNTAEPAAAGSAVSSPAPAAGQRSEAERFFELMDKDKNDKVTEDEFKKSFLMSKKFSDAGISLSFPVTREEFIRQYPQPAGK